MRILVVEDEHTIASYLAQILEAEGFATELAPDGPTGLQKALEGDFDAVTLDIMLPGMNGYDVCRRLREAGVATPVLMLTAKDGEYDEADAFDVGADDFLRKPFSAIVLVARLRSLIRRSARAPQSGTLSCGSLSLDANTRTARRGEAELLLQACNGESILFPQA